MEQESGIKLTPIASMRRIFYDTYANLPTAGLAPEDLGYATDRLVLYRWTGAAWVAITIHVSADIAANIPTAGDLPNGSIYHATDTMVVSMVEAGSWVTIAEAGASLTVAETEVFNGASPISWTDLNLSAVVGANVALVILKIHSGTGSKDLAVRKNGDTDEHYMGTIAARGAALAEGDNAYWGIFVAVTDASGIIEWRTETSVTMTVDVIGFLK